MKSRHVTAAMARFCSRKESKNVFSPPLIKSPLGFLETGNIFFLNPVRKKIKHKIFASVLSYAPFNPSPETLISDSNYRYLMKTENRFHDFFSVQKQYIHGGQTLQNPKNVPKNPKNVPFITEILGLLRGKLNINDENCDNLSHKKLTEEDFVNKDSFEKLLKWIEICNFPMREYPIAKTENFTFFLRSKENFESKKFKKVLLEIRTTGGNCRKIVEKGLQLFFSECGVPSSFQWEKGAWTLGEQKTIKKNTFKSIGNTSSGSLSEIGGTFSTSKKEEFDFGEKTEPDSSNQMEDSFPFQNSSVEKSNLSLEGHEARPILEFGKMGEHQEFPKESEEVGGDSPPPPPLPSPSDSLSPPPPPPLPIEDVVKKLDKVLEAIGYFPWIVDDYEAYKKRVEEALRVFEKDGWTISQATLKIWGGERNFQILVEGLDGGSIQLVKSILYHTKRFDLSHGKRVLNFGEDYSREVHQTQQL